LIRYKYEWFTGQKGCYNRLAGQFDREAKVGRKLGVWRLRFEVFGVKIIEKTIDNEGFYAK